MCANDHTVLHFIFPLVRLCDNKLDLIRQVLDSSPNAYKRYDKVVINKCICTIMLIAKMLNYTIILKSFIMIYNKVVDQSYVYVHVCKCLCTCTCSIYM